MIATDAWILHRGPEPGSHPVRGALQPEKLSLPEPEDDEALVEPLFASWEANLDHAISRQPIDVCHQRHEDQVVLGNLGVVRVLRQARDGNSPPEGAVCLVMPFAKRDPSGYAELIYAYDAPHTIGLLAKRTKLRGDMLLPVPADTKYSLPQWTVYARYFTAWDNWRVARACWAVQMGEHALADNLVFGWGGGVTFAELALARRAGYRVAMTAGSDERLVFLGKHGITAVDRRLFPALAADTGDDQTHRASENAFLATIRELSDGLGVAIFIDNIGAPLYRTTLKSLARQGVLATVGWKHGMLTSVLRANECIKRHLHVHTHVWRYEDCPSIRDYMERTAWLPDVESLTSYTFDEVPRLAADYSAGRIDSYFPLLQVNPL
jgi:NADPH:quinone reductase-like Zn-dependent oxidoreductase